MAKNVKEAINEQGVARVSKAMGVTKMTVYRWRVANSVPLKQIKRFCKLTGLNAAQANPALRGAA